MPKGKGAGIGKGKGSKRGLATIPLQCEETANLDLMSLDSFKMWSEPELKVFLSLRKKATEGTYDELAAR